MDDGCLLKNFKEDEEVNLDLVPLVAVDRRRRLGLLTLRSSSTSFGLCWVSDVDSCSVVAAVAAVGGGFLTTARNHILCRRWIVCCC